MNEIERKLAKKTFLYIFKMKIWNLIDLAQYMGRPSLLQSTKYSIQGNYGQRFVDF